MAYSKEEFKGLVVAREIMGLAKKVVFIGLFTYFVYKTVESVGKHQRQGVIFIFLRMNNILTSKYISSYYESQNSK